MKNKKSMFLTVIIVIALVIIGMILLNKREEDNLTVTLYHTGKDLEFDFEGADEINRPNADEPNLYTLSVRSIDLLPYLRVREDIDAADVRWEIRSGNQYATVENGMLTFGDSAQRFASVVVRVYVAGNPAYTLEAEIIYFPQN